MPAETTVWVCLVCGYVHRGPEPPENCPVCGASRENFERHVEKPAEIPKTPPQQWRCLICGYQHTGPEPPENCPVCGASRDEFEPVEPTRAPEGVSAGKFKAVVLGAGIAGVSAAESLRQHAPDAEIVLVSKEPGLPYYRLNLTRYLADEITDSDLPIHPAEWYTEQRIELRHGEVTAFAPDEHALRFRDGQVLPFDKLVVTCGSHAFVPPIPGSARDGVTVFRTVEHAHALLEMAKPGVKCVCIGGGILGLETAGGLAKRGADVTIVEGAEWLLPRQLDERGGAVLHRYVAAKGIALKYNAKVTEIAGDEHARGVSLADGTTLPADFVVITAGVRCNSYLARLAGLNVAQGIVVDSRLRASHPDIYAAGDVAEFQGMLYGLWEPARYQGVIAGMNAAGVVTEFGGLPRANTLKVLGVDMFSIGAIIPVDGSYEVIAGEIGEDYIRFMFHDSIMVGAILVGDTRLTPAVTAAIKGRMDFSGLLSKNPSANETAEYLVARE